MTINNDDGRVVCVMGCKRFCGVLVSCSLLLAAFCIPAGAESIKEGDCSSLSIDSLEGERARASDIQPYATDRVNFTVYAGEVAVMGESFSLSPGETVNINCLYSPSWTDLDFGLIAPDGLFYYVNASGGNINETISVDEWGQYSFAVRNNSSVDVSVVGFVNY